MRCSGYSVKPLAGDPGGIQPEVLQLRNGISEASTGRTGCALNVWGRVTHICISRLYHYWLNNGLSPGRHQDIIWTNAGILLIPYIFIQENAFENVVYEMAANLSQTPCVNFLMVVYQNIKLTIWYPPPRICLNRDARHTDYSNETYQTLN